MAEVYLARRRAAGIEKWLVVKRMRPERSGDARFLELFVREARLSMSLVHQNIVPVFDFGRIDDQVFLAMERVEGKDLGSSIARARSHRLPPLLAAFIGAECCQALDYAHQRKGPDGVALGIVHRDVTPRNVLLSWSGEVKLTDFGIAALAGDATSRLLGTPQYMAPEQARSEAIDPRADIYAIGLVLREAVTGVRPRPGADREAILDAARRGELLPWSHVAAPAPEPAGGDIALGSGDHGPPAEPAPDAAPDLAPEPIPPALVAIIDRATAVRPEDRYPDARSMLEALDGFIVAERAARKGDPPARQLAAWLARIWEGVRDEVEADPAIGGGDLVSFLDDGALDVIGTGTVRSLAATAADDAPAAPAAPPPVVVSAAPAAPPGGPPPAAPPIVPGATLPAARSAEVGVRAMKISSSNTTVASGSFDALPLSSAHAPARRSGEIAVRRPSPRRIAPFASLLFVGLAAGAMVFFLMTYFHERDQPSTAPPAAGPLAARPSSAEQAAAGSPATNGTQPTGAPPPSAQPAAAPPPSARPTTAPPAGSPPTAPQAGSPAAKPPSAGPPEPSPPGAGPPTSAPSHTTPPGPPGPPEPRHPGSGPPHADPPVPGHSGSGSSRPGPGREGSGGAATAARDGGDPAASALCRVRVNVTPWAYYTVDGDGTHHETPSYIELAPGRHRLHAWNPALDVERDFTIDVPADRDTMTFSEPIRPPAQPSDAPNAQ